MNRDVFWGFFLGVIVMVWLNASPWSDATLYQRALKECERTLPRDQHCKVIGVPQ
jgi:hypothetical protein